MKRLKITGLIIILTIFGMTAASAQSVKFKTWKITVSQSGGFAGINKSYTLDHEGNLNRVSKATSNFQKIDAAQVAEIGRLIRELKLPGTKLKTFKGKRIYDGIYTGLVIALDGREFKVEGTSFDDAQYLALSNRQKAVLEKLKAKLDALPGFLPESMNN